MVLWRRLFTAGPQLYPHHHPSTPVENAVRFVRAALTAGLDPERQDAVATLGETTGHSALTHLYACLLRDKDGQNLLRERPSINSETLSFDNLLQLPKGSFGHEHALRMTREHLTADSRVRVRYVDHADLAYVMRRYREVHDFWHTLTDVPTTVAGELALKWFEWVQTGLPMNLMAATIAPLSLSADEQRLIYEHYAPWALRAGAHARFLMAVKYEDMLSLPLDEVRKTLRIIPAPAPRTGVMSSAPLYRM